MIKEFLGMIVLVAALASCQKSLDAEPDPAITKLISNDAMVTLPCYSTSFVTNYPVLPGKVPPFRFTKTLYADSRVKTINVLSRANPIHSKYKPQAYEIVGTFSYGTNSATLVGTTQLWEYFTTSSGAAGRKLISKKGLSWTFTFHSNGYCSGIKDNYRSGDPYFATLNIIYVGNTKAIQYIQNIDGTGDMELLNDRYGNPLAYVPTWYSLCFASRVNYKYDYTKPTTGKRYSYIPTQNWFGQRYSMAEIMQWIPQSTHQRISVAAEFYPYPIANSDCCGSPCLPGPKVLQTQYYKNHKFDLKGNLISYTYADNVLQKTTWFCKP
jgi:hypothetical protein